MSTGEVGRQGGAGRQDKASLDTNIAHSCVN